ncbi:MAG: hypothetical protein JWL70_1332, partial [Acidimicrobiia bacterium]|nr:hypothetical protein [Acidimicrobiia bacterium]
GMIDRLWYFSRNGGTGISQGAMRESLLRAMKGMICY